MPHAVVVYTSIYYYDMINGRTIQKRRQTEKKQYSHQLWRGRIQKYIVQTI